MNVDDAVRAFRADEPDTPRTGLVATICAAAAAPAPRRTRSRGVWALSALALGVLAVAIVLTASGHHRDRSAAPIPAPMLVSVAASPGSAAQMTLRVPRGWSTATRIEAANRGTVLRAASYPLVGPDGNLGDRTEAAIPPGGIFINILGSDKPRVLTGSGPVQVAPSDFRSFEGATSPTHARISFSRAGYAFVADIALGQPGGPPDPALLASANRVLGTFVVVGGENPPEAIPTDATIPVDPIALRHLRDAGPIEHMVMQDRRGAITESWSLPGVGSRSRRLEQGRVFVERGTQTCSIFTPRSEACWTLGQAVVSRLAHVRSLPAIVVDGRTLVRLQMRDLVGQRHAVDLDPRTLRPVRLVDPKGRAILVLSYEGLPATAANIALVK